MMPVPEKLAERPVRPRELDLRFAMQANVPDVQGSLSKRLKGLEPSTFCMASRRSSQLSYSRAAERV